MKIRFRTDVFKPLR